MLTPGASDAASSLRCSLRTTLRRLSRSGGHFAAATPIKPFIPLQRKHSTVSGHEDHEENGNPTYIRRSFASRIVTPNGRIRRSRGRAQREASEHLATKSLGKDSEVIVLRDVPDNTWDRARESETTTESPAKFNISLSAKEIEAIVSKKQSSPRQDEVNTAIEENRPRESVLSREEFGQKAKWLADSYNKAQLSKYLATLQKSRASQSSRAETGDSTSALKDINFVSRTPWHVGTTDIRNALPRKHRSVIPSSTQLTKKDVVIERIFREGWKIIIEEETKAVGELELLLNPEQWGLLNTRAAEKLFTITRSPLLHQNAHYAWDIKRGALRISGPRTEVEDIADLFEGAFSQAKSYTVSLEKLLKGFDDSVELQQLLQSFTVQQLQSIMATAKVYITLDKDRGLITIHSFQEPSLLLALRLLLGLTDLPSRSSHTLFSDDNVAHKYSIVPCADEASLPNCFRAAELGRRQCQIVKSLQDDDQTHTPPSVKLTSPIIQKVLAHLALCRGPELGARSHTEAKSYWNRAIKSQPWRATLGNLLQPLNAAASTSVGSEDASIALKGSSSERHIPPFITRTPGLLTTLSYFDRPTRSDHMKRPQSHSQVVLKLIPFPLRSSMGTLALLKFPIIEIICIYDNAVAADLADSTSEFEIDARNMLRVVRINAILHEHVCDLALPHHSVDLRLQKRELGTALINTALKDGELRSFLESVVSELRSGRESLAPRNVKLKIPQWMIRQPQPKQHKNTAEVDTEVPYQFHGLEKREHKEGVPVEGAKFVCQLFDPNHELSTNVIDGGDSSGKRMELSVVRTRHITRRSREASEEGTADEYDILAEFPEDLVDQYRTGDATSTRDGYESHETASLEGSPDDKRTVPLVQTALSVVDLVDRLQHKDITSLQREAYRAPISEETAHLALDEDGVDREVTI